MTLRKPRLTDLVVGLGLAILALFLSTLSTGCQSFPSAKAYLVENQGPLVEAGATCLLEKPDEYTLLFGWTFKRDPVTAQYTEDSLTYVTVGVICKKFRDANGVPELPPKVTHVTLTCDVTKFPGESPCGNILEWQLKPVSALNSVSLGAIDCQTIKSTEKEDWINCRVLR